MAPCVGYPDNRHGANNRRGVAGQQPARYDEQLAECASERSTAICPSPCTSFHKQRSCDEHVQERQVGVKRALGYGLLD